MKIKIYKLLSDVKQGLIALALIVFSGTAYSQSTYTFNYTGNVQTLNAQAGSYDIEMWGGDGASSNNNRAGKGGYSKGTLTLLSPTTLYIVVGGGAVYTGAAGLQPGGYNGGGSGYANSTGRAGAGATHIATVTGVLSALAGNQSAVAIVAGGGGGDQDAGVIGHGGGSSGGGSYPGTQTGSGGSAAALFGTFGQGGNITTSYGGGGGGGWYGGGGNQSNAGSGGSGYIGGVTSAITTMSGTTGFVVKPIVSINGLVIIKELCDISLMASGNNSLNPVICSGQSLTLTTNAISNYVWSTGATTSSLVVAPTTNTVYTLTATSPSNCTASKTISVTVSGGQPTLSVASSTNQTCLGKTATLTASGAINYTWTNGVTNGVSFYPSATQTYTVTGDNGCGTVTAVSTISVNPLGVSVVSTGSAVCTNKTATLTVTAAATSYTWQPVNVVNSSTTLIVNPQANTIYTVTASDGTCSGVANISLQADPVPTITSSSSSSMICPGGTVNLTASGGNNYTWTPGPLSGSNVIVSPATSTVYNVVGDNGFGCNNNSSQIVVVGAQPTLGLSSTSSTICYGGSATLTATGSHTYAWTGGPTTNTYIVNPTQLTVYTAVGTNTSSGCFDTKTISVDVYKPVVSISGNTVICSDGVANLTASGASGYTWNPGGSPFAGLSITPASTTIYTVDAIANLGALNCPASQTVQVVVNPNPTITTTSVKTAICPKETNTISASGADTYTWTSATTVITAPSITVSANSATALIYTVTGKNAQGCEGSANLVLTVSPCTSIEETIGNASGIFVYPNPSNGEFVIQSFTDPNVIVLNELGQEILRLKLDETNEHRAYVKDLQGGIYFVKGKNISQKIIVTR